MVLELILSVVIGFVIVVVGSYVGATMALNTFFGRDFNPAELGQASTSKHSVGESE